MYSRTVGLPAPEGVVRELYVSAHGTRVFLDFITRNPDGRASLEAAFSHDTSVDELGGLSVTAMQYLLDNRDAVESALQGMRGRKRVLTALFHDAGQASAYADQPATDRLRTGYRARGENRHLQECFRGQSLPSGFQFSLFS